MRVHGLRFRNFFSHKDTRLTLPPRGVVTVTGSNGSGKSTLPEGVAVACWGHTLRGTPGWADEDCMVEADVEDLTACREWNGKKVSLRFDVEGEEEVEYPTTTKAQTVLESHVGSFDVWRRSHVFSSHDASHFSNATDAERKRLLEAILGLDRFDTALAQCRGDLKSTESKRAAKAAELANYEARLSADRSVVAEADKALKTMDPEPDGQLDLVDAAEIKAAEMGIHACSADIAEKRAELDEERQLVAEAGATMRSAQGRMKRLDVDECPTCEQPIPQALKDRLVGESFDAERRAQSAYDDLQRTTAQLRGDIDELEDEKAAFQAKRTKLLQKRAAQSATKAERDKYAATKKQLEESRTFAKRRIGALVNDVKRAKGELAQLEKEWTLLKATESVLGLKGVRAHVLGAALGGLETVANRWLERISFGGIVPELDGASIKAIRAFERLSGEKYLRIKLSPYSTKKTGGVSDAISLKVEGAGNGHGYKASSGGERRRIDVALLFALAEVAGAASGKDGGTLWFDEVFDALDDEGVEAVASALARLARDRCVVVITHNPALVASITKAREWRVEEGRVTEVRCAA